MQPIFDGHNDTLISSHHEQLVEGSAEGHIDLPRMRRGGMRGGLFAVFVESPGGGLRVSDPGGTLREDGSVAWPEMAPVEFLPAAAQAAKVAGRLFALERDGHLKVARTIADVDSARAGDGPPVAVLHIEGAEPIDPGLETLDFWYAAGLRSIGPVWSRSNAFGHGVPFVFPSSPDTGPGLTEAGIALVLRCAELGIAVDLSHLNEAGFWDVARLDPGPLVASHSGAHALAGTSRNLTDAQLDAIGASGGLVGIVYATPFLRSDFANDPNTDLRLIAEHARYIADRIGVAHVALGSDFDGAVIPAGLGDVSGLPRLLAAFAEVGFSAAEIDDIAWNNWRRVLAVWWR